MPEADLTLTISIFIPVMLLVVVEIASIAREIDLEEHHPDNRIPYQPEFDRKGAEFLSKYLKLQNTEPVIPQFGHFGSLHAISTVLLLAGMAVVGYAVSDPTRYVLSIFVVSVLSLLPYLEIDEYADIRRNGVPTSSIKYHIVPAFFAGVFCGFAGDAVRVGVSPVIVVLIIFPLVILPFAISQLYFSDRLATEIRKGIIEP